MIDQPQLEGGPARADAGRRHLLRRLRVAPLLLLAGIALAGCNYPAFEAENPADLQGRHIFYLWSGMVIAGLIVGGFVLVLILWASFRYRAPKNDDGAVPKQTHSRIGWEVAYTTVPILIVAGIFGFTLHTLNEVDAMDPHPALKVHVIAYRWGWIFDYLGTNVSIHTTTSGYPQLVLPENETTEIILTSNDVVHEFMVPAFLFGRYAQPGIVNRFDFTPSRTGVFQGHCAVYCGLYHAEMLFTLRVAPPATFSSWLQTQEAHAA